MNMSLVTLLVGLFVLITSYTNDAVAFAGECKEWSSLGSNDCLLDLTPFINVVGGFTNHIDEITGETVSDSLKLLKKQSDIFIEKMSEILETTN